MSNAPATCWTVIQGAAAGRAEDREDFARRYEPIIRAYLAARWAGSPLVAEIDDALQEIFVDCFRAGGVLERAEVDKPGGFRSFLYGVIRIAALRAEKGRTHRDARASPTSVDLAGIAADETTMSRMFDREWARAQVRSAMRLQEQRAKRDGPEALRRVELLRIRFVDGKPIREIAEMWGVDPAQLHRDQTRGRREFKKALFDVIRAQSPGSDELVVLECEELLARLRDA